MGRGRGISHVDMPRDSQDGGRAEVYHMLICRGRAKMGRGRGISHVDMPRESQDGGGQRYITC